MGAATHPRAPERRKGAGPRDWKPCPSAFRGSPDPCLRLLLWSGDWMQAEAQPQIKASSLDRPPGRLLRLPPERSGGLLAATGKFEPGGRFQSSRVGVAGCLQPGQTKQTATRGHGTFQHLGAGWEEALKAAPAPVFPLSNIWGGCRLFVSRVRALGSWLLGQPPGFRGQEKAAGAPALGFSEPKATQPSWSPQGRAACLDGVQGRGVPQASGGQAPLAPPPLLGKPP